MLRNGGTDGESVRCSELLCEIVKLLMVCRPGVGTCKTVYMASWGTDVVAALEIRSGDAREEVAVLRRLSAHPNLPIFHGVAMGPVSSHRTWHLQMISEEVDICHQDSLERNGICQQYSL